MRDGDFSVRLPGYWTGLHGKIADTFNEIVAANQQMSRELTRVGQAVGKEGRTSERTRFHRVERLLGRDGSLGQHAGRGSASPDDGSDSRDRGRRARKFDADRAPRRGWAPARRRVPAIGEHRQHDDSAVGRVHRRSDARGARGGHRRKARRASAGARRGGHLERPDRFRELDGQQPDRPGAQHRRSGDRGGQRRLVAQDYRGRARRNSAAEGSHQHDGGPVAVIRFGSDARGARGGHGRKTRRAGGCARRRGNVEGSYRLG